MKKTFTLLLLCFFISSVSLAGPDDSVTVSASAQYSKPGILKRFFIGSNYRKIWAQPVKMKVFHIQTEKGGFTIKKLGGGMQTKSLKIIDKNGIEWTLRTVEKDVTKAVEAQGYKTTGFIKNVTQDMISAAHPYAPLTVPVFSRALGVIAAEPELFFVPDDPAFGEFKVHFANTVCMLEKEMPTFDDTHSLDTEDLLKVMDEKIPVIDHKTLLQARLIDMLIGDWDRHGKQWQWGIRANERDTVYYPIPKDRDQAFFNYNGVLIKMIRPLTFKHMVGFRKRRLKITTLNRKEWEFDRLYLSQLSAADWENGIKFFQATLNDSVLHAAIQQMPPETNALEGEKVFKKLERRRDVMLKKGMKYYRFLTQTIMIRGSKEGEVFKISKSGELFDITVYNGATNRTIYHRKLQKGECRQILIDGKGGNDVFQVDETIKDFDVKITK
jgi:hypothetical protein